jgi:hypothetical protein
MTADSPQQKPSDTPAQRVETDLPCARCGYNLRTLAWESKCPECGAPVLRSGLAVGFRFRSRRAERRVGTGIAVLATGLLVETLGIQAMTVATWLIFVIPLSLQSVAIHIWSYAGWFSSFTRFAAILLIVQPFAGEDDRFKPRFGLAIAVLALIGILAVMFELALRLPGLSVGTRPVEVALAEYFAGVCALLAYLLAAVHLLLRIDRRSQPLLWVLMCLAAATQALLLSSAVSGAALYFFGTTPFIPGFDTGTPTTGQHLLWLLLQWQKNIVPTCGIAMLSALWVFLRRLRGAPRKTI